MVEKELETILSEEEIGEVLNIINQNLEEFLDEIIFDIDVEYASGVIPEIKKEKLESIDLEKLKETLVIYGGWTDPIGQIRDFIYDSLKGFSSWIISGVEGIISPIKGLIDSISSTLGGLWDFVSDTLYNIIKDISSGIDWIKDSLSSIENILSDVGKTLSNIVDTISKTVRSSIEDFVSKVLNSIGNLKDYISQIIDLVQKNYIKPIEDFVSKIPDIFKSLIESGKTWIEENIIKPLQGFKDEVIEFFTTEIPKYFEGIKKSLDEKIINPIVKTFGEITSWFEKDLPDFLKKLPEYTLEGLEDAQRWIWEHLPDWFKRFITEDIPNAFATIANYMKLVSQSITGFVNAILKFPEWFPRWFEEHISKPIKNALKGLSDWIWKAIPDWLKNSFNAIYDFFTKTLPDFIKTLTKGTQDFIKDPLGWINRNIVQPLVSGLSQIGNWIWNAIPDWIKTPLTKIGEFFTDLGEKVMEFLKDPIGYIWNFIKTLGEKIFKEISWVVEVLREVLGSVGHKLYEILSSIGRGLWGTVQRIYSAISSWAENICKSLFVNPLETVFKKLSESLQEAFVKVLKGKEGAGEFIFIGYLIPSALIPYLSFSLPFAVVEGLDEHLKEIEVSLEPLGLGGRIKTKLLSIIRSITKIIKKSGDKLLEGPLLGLGLMVLEPLRYLVRPIYKQAWTPIFKKALEIDAFFEIPSFTELRDLVRRHMPTSKDEEEEFKKMIKYFKTILNVRGFPDSYIEKILSLADTWKIVVKDRFGKNRTIGLSPIYEQPSISDLTTFMIRDMIGKPEHFIEWIKKLGVERDLALFYYLLHFRYPSPEKLAEFFWRGVAGELWNPDKSMDEEAMKVFGLDPNDIKAVAPKELNFKVEVLQEMLKTYMKWHDYARFPWQKDWATDNAIITDLLADIPLKIDLRWMTRWGIFDYWSSKGIGLTTSIEEITKSLLKERETCPAKEIIEQYKKMLSQPSIEMDLRQFSRTIQATGLHPYWVPWVTIAESINTLTDERTYIRTGFINLFKEGLFKLENLNDLLSGFFTVTFKTGYFDMEKGKWVATNVEYPIAFLPAESKLLEIRAIMDRSVDVFRDFMKVLGYSVRELIYDPETALNILKSFIEKILSPWFSSQIKKVTGKELKLTLDEDWCKSFLEYEKIQQEISNIERSRYYLRYVISKLLDRFSKGLLTKKERTNLISKIKEITLLSDREIKLIEFVGDQLLDLYKKDLKMKAILSRLSRREITKTEAITELKKLGLTEDMIKDLIDKYGKTYVPTITSYATLTEIVPEAIETGFKYLDIWGVPEDEKKYWKLYLERKHVQDEFTLIRTRIYNALSEGGKIEDIIKILDAKELENKLKSIYEQNKEIFLNYGISFKELILYHVIAELEKYRDTLKERLKEKYPSPSTMATLSEYVEIPIELIKKTLDVYGIVDEWKEYFLKYILIRPIATEVNQVVSEFLRIEEYFKAPQELEKKIKELMKIGGWTKREIELFNLRLELRKQYRIASWLLPSLREFISDARYIPNWEDLLKQWFERRGIEIDKYKDYYEYYRTQIKHRKIWRRINSFITELINDYASRVIEEDYLRNQLNELKKYGLEDEEIEIIVLTAKHRRMRYDKIYGGQHSSSESSTPRPPSPPSSSSLPTRPVPLSQLFGRS